MLPWDCLEILPPEFHQSDDPLEEVFPLVDHVVNFAAEMSTCLLKAKFNVNMKNIFLNH